MYFVLKDASNQKIRLFKRYAVFLLSLSGNAGFQKIFCGIAGFNLLCIM